MDTVQDTGHIKDSGHMTGQDSIHRTAHST